MRELDVERDDRFTAIERTVNHVALAVMALVVLAGALGVFGFGPLSSTTRTGNGFAVTYDRFARNGAPLTFEFTIDDADNARVWLDTALLDAVQIEQVVPAATQQQRTADGATFRFARAASATFDLTGDRVGLVRGRAGTSPDNAVPITLVMYP